LRIKIRKKPKSHVKPEHVWGPLLANKQCSKITRARHGGRILSVLTQFQSMKDVRLPFFCIWRKYKYCC